MRATFAKPQMGKAREFEGGSVSNLSSSWSSQLLNSANEVNENSMVRVNTTSEMESFQEIVEKCEIRDTQSTK